MPKISIIILNWNGWEDTIECLESLYRISYKNYEVIIVDNFSTNDSIQRIKDWSEWKIEVQSKFFETTKCTHNIKILEYTKADLDTNLYLKWKKEFDTLESNKKLLLFKNDKNDGFAGWCNLGMREVLKENKSDFIFLLNNDTVIDINYFHDIFEWLKKQNIEKIGCIWAKIFNYYTDDFRIRKYKAMQWIQQVHELTWAGLFISTKALQTEWLFDEYLFLYCEDYDLTYRISYSYENYYIDTPSKMYHKSEASSKNIFENKLILQIRNQFILYKRHKKYFSTYQFLRTLYIFLKWNIKINFFIALKAFFLWCARWIKELFINKWPKY